MAPIAISAAAEQTIIISFAVAFLIAAVVAVAVWRLWRGPFRD